MDPAPSGTGVFYQAMPAVGADGKKIMKLIPVQMVNGQFVQTQISKARMVSTPQRPVTINFSSTPVHLEKKAALNPPATQQIVSRQVPFRSPPPKEAGLDLGNSLNKQPPLQQAVNVRAKVPVITIPATNVGNLVRLPCQLPVTVKPPALPTGQYLQIPHNAQVQGVPAPQLPVLIKKQIFTTSASSSPGPGLSSVVYVSPVMTVNQDLTPPCVSALPSLNLLSNTSNKTPSGPPAKGLKSLLKLVPKVSQRPNSPIKWVIEEEDCSTAPNLTVPDPSSVTSEILRTVAERENARKPSDDFRKNSESSQSGQRQDNALVVCNGKVFSLAKACNLPLAMGKSNPPTAATDSYECHKSTVPATQQSLESDAAETQQDLRVIIPDESDEVIDLCDDDDDAQEGSSQPAASVNVSAVSLQDDDNVIFVSYIPPKSEAGSRHRLRVRTQTGLEKETKQTSRSSSDTVTEEKRLDGGSGSDEGSAVRGGQSGQSRSVSTAKNVPRFCGSAVMNMDDNESTSTQQVERVEADTDSSTDSSSGAGPLKQDSHRTEIIPDAAPGGTSSNPCQVDDHQLRQIFGITAEARVGLQRIDEASASQSESLSSELFLQNLHGSCKNQQTDTCSRLIDVKTALLKLKTNPLSAVKSKCHSGQRSLKRASCAVDSAPVIGYVEPIDEDFPSTDSNGSPDTTAQLQTPTCVDLNTNTRRIGRTRKRTMCPCCVPGFLEPAVKSSTRLDESERWTWMTEGMSKKGGRTKAPRKDGKTCEISCLTARNRRKCKTDEVPAADSLPSTTWDSDKLTRHKQVRRLKEHLEKELMSDTVRTQTDQLLMCVQGNRHDMDPPGRLEIYIPAEAEVKNIPLWSLPKSVLRRMGLPPSDSEGSTKLAGSPEGIWICPVTLRRKGQKGAENMSSVLGTEFTAAPGPLRMSFVSSNRTAYQLLKDVPGKKVSAERSLTSPTPQALGAQMHRDAVVIYRGNIYLSIRRPSRSQRKRETRDPQPTARSSSPSTSSSKGQRKELLNDNRPKKKHTTCKVTHSENKKDVTHKVRDVSSSRTARCVPQSTGSEHKVDSHCHTDARGEEAAAVEPAWFQTQEAAAAAAAVANTDSGECEMQDLDGEEAESTNQNSDMDTNMQINGGEVNRSSTRTEPLAAAQASTSQMKEFDFEQLAQDERIARMKARLRQNEAALSNFPSL
ncbi:uncharacterized protein lrif1 [Trachinotus anak]|uniref:uncharacterized protein lrif1 n=1 Tax=Trachinotus anak TaxID=443729 RepID=UPI0039F223CC